MPKIRVTTDRLPQPERHRGAILNVSDEKAASMVAQGFAEIIDGGDEVTARKRAPRRRKVL